MPKAMPGVIPAMPMAFAA